MTMANDQETQREKDYWLLRAEASEVLSQAAGTVISEAERASYLDQLVQSCSYQWEDYEEAKEKMRLAAAQLTDRDYELLTRLWLAALAAAASIDPDDDRPGARYKSLQGYYHWYYRMLSSMVQKTLDERKITVKPLAEDVGPDDYKDIPF